MSDTSIQSPSLSSPSGWRQAWLCIDENQLAIEFCKSTLGKLTLYLSFVALYAAIAMGSSDGIIRINHVGLVAATLALCWAFPAKRMLVIALTGTAYFIMRPFKSPDYYNQFAELTGSVGNKLALNGYLAATGFAFMVFAYAMIKNSDRKYIPFVADRPLLTMVLSCFGLTIVSAMIPQGTALFSTVWIMLAYLGSTFFFLGYILIDHKSKNRQPLAVEAGFMRPFWAGFATPVKGPGYFPKFEAKNDDELAVSQLKGLKLMVWAAVLLVVYELVFAQAVYGSLGVPELLPLIIASAEGNTVSLGMRWLAVGVNFIALVTKVAVTVHTLIAIIRAAGFCVPRGMVRPLESRTIAEFWGKYLYYFKEMLVDFFFYPAFRRYFKKSPKIRMAFATFAAAFIGNILFDLLHALPIVSMEGPWHIIDRYITYTVYAAVLTAGIIWAQQFQKAPKPEHGFWRYSVWPRVQVIGFFALIQVIDDSFGKATLMERLDFFGSLFMIGV